jgi:hypothetical protein
MKALAAMVVALGACLSQGAAAAEKNYAPDFTCEGGPYGLTLPQSYTALARLKSVRGNELVDDGKSKPDSSEVRKLHFDGLALTIAMVNGIPGRYIVVTAEISKPRWKVGPIAVGQSLDTASRLMLARHVTLDASHSFVGDTDSATIVVEDSKITAIHFACYTG